ncbi:glycosyltransferase [Methylocystis parvus]|uniref:glycosyltransferase n=1 Tax=Methylocystis parvus TaxID=134 RepID=UPI003C70F647
MTRLAGNIEHFDCDHLIGWVIDLDRPDEPVLLELVDETGSVLTRLLADHPRDDLKTIGHSSNHGFEAWFSDTVFPYSRQIVSIRTVKGEDLPGSPVLLRKKNPAFDESVLNWLHRTIQGEIANAGSAKDLYPALGAVLGLLNEVAEARRRFDDAATSASLPNNKFFGKFADIVQAARTDYPELALATSRAPVVSIIVPVYNGFDFTYRCLASFARAEIRTRYELIVVDDGSLDETLLAPLLFKGAKIVRNDENLGFVGSCNKGARAAQGKFLLFLNNDTELTENAVDALVETFEMDDRIGVAGAKLLFPNGKLQEAGGIVWRLGDAWNFGRGKDPEAPQYSYLRDADYVSGAALMIEKALFDELDGFDAHYSPAYYEDADLCFRARQKGKRVVVQPLSQVVHFEGATSGTSTASGAKRYQAVNHHKFRARWRDVLASHRLNGEQPELECERHVTRRALFIDNTALTPDEDAGSLAALEHIRGLQRLGYKVTFAPSDNMSRIEPHTSRLQAMGVECLYLPYVGSVEEALRQAIAPFDVVYLHRYSNASKYIGMVRRYHPKAQIVFSVCDLHYLRLQREAAVTKLPEILREAEEMRRLELAAINQSDSVLVYSFAEADILRQEKVSARIGVAPWEVTVNPTKVDVAERLGIAFVGGYGHPPNVDAAKVLALDLMPLVRAREPKIVCQLVGSNMPSEIADLAGPDIRAVGKIEQLDTLFEQVRITVAPLRYGAGVKGKVLYSLAAGVPCVMTPIAAEGLPLTDELQYLVADSLEEQADKIVRLHNDIAFHKDVAKAGLDFISRFFSRDTVDGALRRLLAAKAAA